MIKWPKFKAKLNPLIKMTDTDNDSDNKDAARSSNDMVFAADHGICSRTDLFWSSNKEAVTAGKNNGNWVDS